MTPSSCFKPVPRPRGGAPVKAAGLAQPTLQPHPPNNSVIAWVLQRQPTDLLSAVPCVPVVMTGLQGWTNPVIACVLQPSASGLDSSFWTQEHLAKALQQACASLRPCAGCSTADSQQPALTGSEGHLSSWEELPLRAGSTQSLTGLISPSTACKGLRQQRKIRQSQLDHWFSHGPDPDLR